MKKTSFEGATKAKRFFLAVLTFLPLAVLLPQMASAANLLVNGDFEFQPLFGFGVSNNAGYSAFTGSQMPGWTIEPLHAVTVHNNVYPIITGVYSVNMDGEGYNGRNANFYQDFAAANGQNYVVQFDWATWSGDTTPNLDVSVIDLVTLNTLYHVNLPYNAGLHHVNGIFTGAGNQVRLRIRENPESGVNDNSYIVDNFSVTPSVLAVPEPSTYALMLAGLGFVGFVASRRRKSQTAGAA